jgi:hypothetical protein
MHKYVKTDDTGWVLAKPSSEDNISLCAYTKATFVREKDERTYFTVNDGTHKSKIVSMKSSNYKTYLSSKPGDIPKTSGAVLTVTYGKRMQVYSQARQQTLDQQLATLKYGGKTAQVTLNSVWDQGFTPIPVGEYKILIPDTPHNANMTSIYRKVEENLRYDQVWFPIEYGDHSRYVHVGNLSDGCVTVMDLGKWNEIYRYLIEQRTSEKHVGKLVVRK